MNRQAITHFFVSLYIIYKSTVIYFVYHGRNTCSTHL